VCLDPQAGAQPENRPGILGDVRLVKRDPHVGPAFLADRHEAAVDK
jgi:hypothetical protein